ncbi:MAG: hypothetical protein JNM30_08505 [Rhodospirillales bacterium]|nr:hypothetical protein [Rhodospirillales bacterium]
MLRDQKLAATILRALVGTGASLDRSIAIVKAKGSAGEFNAYRAAVGQVMGELWTRAMAPLLLSHPHLTPKALRAENEKKQGTQKTRRSSVKKAQSKRRKSNSPRLQSKRARKTA